MSFALVERHVATVIGDGAFMAGRSAWAGRAVRSNRFELGAQQPWAGAGERRDVVTCGAKALARMSTVGESSFKQWTSKCWVGFG